MTAITVKWLNVPQNYSVETYCYKRIFFIQVLSGDSVKIWGAPRVNEPPLERQLNLLGINAPKLARRPAGE